MINSYEHAFIHTNDIDLHVVMAGPENGRPVILLHGFPEFWYGWRRQIPALAERGFRVIVPDQRGYNLSSKPTGIEAYPIDTLARDIIGLADALGIDQFSLVGHDWGGEVSWWLASRYRERLKQLVILNVPHYAVMSRALKQSWSQRLKSWYIYYFQIKTWPELTVKSGLFGAMQRSSRPGTFTDQDGKYYRESWSQPGALTAMINWYRALRLAGGGTPRIKIRVPTLVIWGARDAFLNVEMAQQSVDLCSDGRLELLPQATHWVQHEEAERVNALLGAFLQ